MTLPRLFGSLFAAGQSTFERGQGFRAHMMLDTLGIELRDGLWHPQRAKEAHDRFMTELRFGCKFLAGGCQKDRPVRLRRDVTGFLEPCHGAIDCNVCHTQPDGQIGDARFPDAFSQLGDRFDVVLCDFPRMSFPGSAKAFGLRG